MPKKRIITKKTEIETIIQKCQVCYAGMVDENNNPYVVPFNFGYRDKCIFLHSAQTGKKIDILKNNNNVCIAFSTDHIMYTQSENIACSYSMSYKSVICYGKVEFIEETEQKIIAMNIIMQHYTGKDFNYSEPSIINVLVYKVIIDKMSGKEFGKI